MPALAYADAAVPMIFMTFPSMLIALFPIVLIEAAVYQSSLRVRYKSAIVPSAVANLASTIVGIPLAWAILFAIQAALFISLNGLEKVGIPTKWFEGPAGDVFLVILSGGLIPPGARDEVYLWYPIGAMVGLIPAYFISVAIETRIVCRLLKGAGKAEIWQAVRKANKLTYGLLFIVLSIFLICTVNLHNYFDIFFWFRWFR